MRRPKLALMLAILALAAAGVGGRALFPRVRDAMIGGLVRLAVDAPTEVDSPALAVGQAPSGTLETLDGPASEAGAPAPAPRRGTSQVAGAVDIPENRVARLTEKQLRSLQPANVITADGVALGVRLHGVGALAVGLGDGDVVTSIDGRATPDVTTGMDAVLRAWSSGEAAARATVLRAGRPLLCTVHIPRHSRQATDPRRSVHPRNDD